MVEAALGARRAARCGTRRAPRGSAPVTVRGSQSHSCKVGARADGGDPRTSASAADTAGAAAIMQTVEPALAACRHCTGGSRLTPEMDCPRIRMHPAQLALVLHACRVAVLSGCRRGSGRQLHKPQHVRRGSERSRRCGYRRVSIAPDTRGGAAGPGAERARGAACRRCRRASMIRRSLATAGSIRRRPNGTEARQAQGAEARRYAGRHRRRCQPAQADEVRCALASDRIARLSKVLERWPSGRRRWTGIPVMPARVYVGSNPTLSASYVRGGPRRLLRDDLP